MLPPEGNWPGSCGSSYERLEEAIVLLRHPLDAIFSYYQFFHLQGEADAHSRRFPIVDFNPTDFRDFVLGRAVQLWHDHIRFYSSQPFKRRFGINRTRVLWYERLTSLDLKQ